MNVGVATGEGGATSGVETLAETAETGDAGGTAGSPREATLSRDVVEVGAGLETWALARFGTGAVARSAGAGRSGGGDETSTST